MCHILTICILIIYIIIIILVIIIIIAYMIILVYQFAVGKIVYTAHMITYVLYAK